MPDDGVLMTALYCSKMFTKLGSKKSDVIKEQSARIITGKNINSSYMKIQY